MSPFNAYSVLGGHPGMSQDELKALHRVLSNKYHPDRRGGDTLLFMDVQAAWKQVKTPEARKLLTTKLMGLGRVCHACDGRGYTRHQKGFSKLIKTACGTCGSCGFIPYGDKS